MIIRKSRKTGRLIIDGQGDTILLEPGKSIEINNLDKFKITNFKIRRKQSPLFNMKNVRNGIITNNCFADKPE